MAEAIRTTFELEIVTPDRLLVRDEVSELVAPGAEGYFGVLPDHMPFITTLKIGVLSYWKGGLERHLAVAWGYVEVRGDKVLVLAERAERPEEIDVGRAERARERAERFLHEYTGGNESIDFARAQAALQRALTRLEAARLGR